MTRTGSFWKTFWMFTAAGPTIPATIFALLILATVAGDPENAGDASLGFAIFIAVISYLAGLIPAGLTGWLCARLSPRLKTLGSWIGVSTAVGAGVSLPCGFWIMIFSDWERGSVLVWLLIFAVSGAVAAAVASVLARRMRPRELEDPAEVFG